MNFLVIYLQDIGYFLTYPQKTPTQRYASFTVMNGLWKSLRIIHIKMFDQRWIDKLFKKAYTLRWMEGNGIYLNLKGISFGEENKIEN